MNSKFITYNFQEIQEEVEVILRDMKAGGMTEDKFRKSVQHIYHHLNTAWNGRNAPGDALDVPHSELLKKWEKFPTDMRVDLYE